MLSHTTQCLWTACLSSVEVRSHILDEVHVLQQPAGVGASTSAGAGADAGAGTRGAIRAGALASTGVEALSLPSIAALFPRHSSSETTT